MVLPPPCPTPHAAPWAAESKESSRGFGSLDKVRQYVFRLQLGTRNASTSYHQYHSSCHWALLEVASLESEAKSWLYRQDTTQMCLDTTQMFLSSSDMKCDPCPEWGNSHPGCSSSTCPVWLCAVLLCQGWHWGGSHKLWVHASRTTQQWRLLLSLPAWILIAGGTGGSDKMFIEVHCECM